MGKRHLACDKTEMIVAIMVENKTEFINLTYDKITRILLDSCMETQMLFKKVPSEKIEITVRNREFPIVFTKIKDKEYFDEYKQELEKFAKANRITFVNNLSA